MSETHSVWAGRAGAADEPLHGLEVRRQDAQAEEPAHSRPGTRVCATGGATAQPRNPRPAISCVVPAYNEAQNLGRLLTELSRELVRASARWEIIVVDDGSRDATPAVVLPWLVHPGVRYVRLSRNFGKEAALTAGIDRARGEVVLLLDADLQHPPAMLAPMLAAWVAGADMVSAVRSSRDDEGLLKRLGTRLFYTLVNRSSAVRIPVDAGDFRLMDRRVVDAIKAMPERNRFMKGIYAWVGFENVVLPYTPAERFAGATHFSAGKLLRLAFTGLTAFSNAPLRWWSGIGASVALAAFTYGCWIVLEHAIYGVEVPGWATVVAGMMFLSGVQLLSIGMLGEYVGRIFDEVKQRPLYVVGAEAGQGIAATAARSDMADADEQLHARAA